MSILKMILGKHAATHYAEKYWPSHDGTLNLVEARRGRGKSFGAVRITAEWLKLRWADIVSGVARFARVFSNIKFKIRRLAHLLMREKIADSLEQALNVLSRVIVYISRWDQVLTAYDSLVLLDEANRNLNIYNSAKNIQVLMNCVHDWLQQTRKHILTLWFFVQDVSWIKEQVLSLCDRLWRAKRVRRKGTPFVKYFPWYGSDPYAKGKGGPLSRSADFKMKFDFDLWTARCYDTLQAVSTLAPESQFETFEQISNYMLENGLKPEPIEQEADYLTWAQEQQWWSDVQSVVIGPLAPAPAPLPALWAGGGVGVAEAVLPPPLDLSQLAVSYPRKDDV